MDSAGELVCLDPRRSTTRRLVAHGVGATGSGAPEWGGRAEGGLRLAGYGKAGWVQGAPPDRPLLSVVTVVRNGERHLEATIHSVLDQTYDNVEYIVVDGASKDSTLNIVRRYEGVLDYWVSEPDGGIYEAMNKGLALAMGDAIGILNADDRYAPDALECAARALTETHADYTYGSVARIDDAGRITSVTHPLSPERFAERCITQGPFPHPSVFVRRRVYDRIGTFDTGFRIAADRDFIARMILSGHTGAQMRATVAFMHRGGASDRLPIWRESRRVARKHGLPVWRAFLQHLVSTGKIFLTRSLPRPLVGVLLRLKGSRHRWTDVS